MKDDGWKQQHHAVSGRVERGDRRREQSGRGKALWKGLLVRENPTQQEEPTKQQSQPFCWLRLKSTIVPYQLCDGITFIGRVGSMLAAACLETQHSSP